MEQHLEQRCAQMIKLHRTLINLIYRDPKFTRSVVDAIDVLGSGLGAVHETARRTVGGTVLGTVLGAALGNSIWDSIWSSALL